MDKAKVLALYRQILRTARTWKAVDPGLTQQESEYIRKEARALFKQNATLSDHKQIEDCIREAETRIALASHYKNPYPRPINVAPNIFPVKGKMLRGQQKLRDQSRPVYVNSYKP